MGTMLAMNKILSICIPTYNRAAVLEKLLHDLIPKLTPYHIPIYISDNNSSDHTKDIVTKAQQAYPFIVYHKNLDNIGADRNFENVLKMSTTNYAWLLGDDDRLVADAISTVLTIIEHKPYDIIISNGCDKSMTLLKKSNLPSTEYTDFDPLLTDLWHTMTWMSTLIYSKEIITNGNFRKYYDTNFLQAAVIFDYIANKKKFSAYWNELPLVIYPYEDEIINHYTDKLLYLFLKCWVDTITALPQIYSKHAKISAIQSTDISFRLLLGLKIQNRFTHHEYLLYKDYFNYFTTVPTFILGIISIIPYQMIAIPHKIITMIKQTLKR